MSPSNEPVAPAEVATPSLHHASTRRVIDEQGILWRISERPNTFDRHTGWSLVFESMSAVRSVATYPDDWDSLEAAELIELSSPR